MSLWFEYTLSRHQLSKALVLDLHCLAKWSFVLVDIVFAVSVESASAEKKGSAERNEHAGLKNGSEKFAACPSLAA